MSFDKDRMEMMAKLADLSYKPIEKREQYLEDNNMLNWQIDYQLSNGSHVVVVNSDDGEIVLSIAGTRVSKKKIWQSVGDLFSDALLTFGHGKISPRYIQAEKVIKRVIKKYCLTLPDGTPDCGGRLVLVAHSLGGYIIDELSKIYGLESHLFNPASSLVNSKRDKNSPILTDPLIEEKTKNNHTYLTSDPVGMFSLLDPYQNIHIIKSQGSNVHSIDNFTKDSGDLIANSHMGITDYV